MCGILFYTAIRDSPMLTKEQFELILSSLHHRGPDDQGVYYHQDKTPGTSITDTVAIGHTRLSINGVNDGKQPLVSGDGRYVLSVNGEIYNHQELWNEHCPMRIRRYKTDCEVIIPLYEKFGQDVVHYLDGIFAFVIYDTKEKSFFAARDSIGVLPLYYNHDLGTVDLTGHFFISSECKCLREEEINNKYYLQENTRIVPPGHGLYFHPEMEGVPAPQKYYYPKWETQSLNLVPNVDMNLLKATLRQKLTTAVDKRLMAEVPFGVLLSGGLDSSLIASITSRLMKERGKGPIHTFSIGLDGSPDLIAAKKVADFIGSIHHEYHFTPEEGLENLQALIYHLETYDVTTVRASLPMYLLSKRIHEEGFKMVLSGEGADEVLGGYLYFHQAPNVLEFHKECKRRVNQLHAFDCLRANKSTMAWSIEARVPFLDKDFLDFAMLIHPNWKCFEKKEKWVLRAAFDTPEHPYLPDEILWRQKEQFSDGVGYNWIDTLKHYTQTHPYVQQIEPKNREREFYKILFHDEFSKHFNEDEIIKHWIPRTDWANVGEDPSGRAQLIHEQTTQKNNVKISTNKNTLTRKSTTSIV